MDKKLVDSIVRAQAVALSDSELNQVQSSRQLNIFRQCVQNAVMKYKETRQYNDFPRTGRPKKNPNRGVRHLKRLVKDDGRLSAAKITLDLNASLPKPVSTKTICRYLRDLQAIPLILKQNTNLFFLLFLSNYCKRCSIWDP